MAYISQKKKKSGGRGVVSTNVQRQESGGCDQVVRPGLREMAVLETESWWLVPKAEQIA